MGRGSTRRENVGEMVDGQASMLFKFGLPMGPVVRMDLDAEGSAALLRKPSIQREAGPSLVFPSGIVSSLPLQWVSDSAGQFPSPQLALGRADMLGAAVSATLGLNCSGLTGTSGASGADSPTILSARFARVQLAGDAVANVSFAPAVQDCAVDAHGEALATASNGLGPVLVKATRPDDRSIGVAAPSVSMWMQPPDFRAYQQPPTGYKGRPTDLSESNLGSGDLHAAAAAAYIDEVRQGGCGSYADGCNATHPCSWVYWREQVSVPVSDEDDADADAKLAGAGTDTGVRVLFGNLETRLSGGVSSLDGDASTWRSLTLVLRLGCDLGLTGVKEGQGLSLVALAPTESQRGTTIEASSTAIPVSAAGTVHSAGGLTLAQGGL